MEKETVYYMLKRTTLFLCLLWGFLVVTASASPSHITRGDKGSEVVTIQQELKQYGFLRSIVSGVVDEDTIVAIKAFQEKCGLEVDGIIGPQTRQALAAYRPENTSRHYDQRGQEIARQALRFLGTPYVWAGKNPGGFDCSGFTYYLFQQQRIAIPRMADGQFYAGHSVAWHDLREGDLVFFTTYEPGPSHVGIYIGDGKFIHASSAAGRVVITPLSSPYYNSRFLGAKRFS